MERKELEQRKAYNYRTEYKEPCPKCMRTVSCWSQGDNHPEYRTDVAVECPNCGEFVEFSLPVN